MIMKQFYSFIAAVLFTSTVSAQFTITDVTVNGQAFKKITGTINVNQTLNNSFLWLLSDTVFVAPGAKLTITAGTSIFAETPATLLYVNTLGEVDWQGTATNPIVFNSLANAPGQGAGSTAAGQWHGIRIDGNGAGTNAGTIRYLRQMYAGFGVDVNAFQLDNVGSGTTVEYVQVFRNSNRGFRINGGDVNLKYVISTNSADAGFRSDSSWDGAGQFWIVNKNIAAGNAIEVRLGNGVLSNVTVTGAGINVTSGTPVGGGIRPRNTGTAKIYNTVVAGVDTSLRFSDGSEAGVTSGASFFRNSAVFSNNINGGTGIHSTAAVFNPSATAYNSAFNNSVASFTISDSYVGTSTLNSTAAGVLDSSFTDVNYVGAVQSGPGNDWTAGWCFNLDGTLRQASLSNEEFEKVIVTTYSNPVQDHLRINSNRTISSIFVYDSLGKLISQDLSFEQENNQIDMSNFRAGLYFVKVTSGDGVETLKVIKQ